MSAQDLKLFWQDGVFSQCIDPKSFIGVLIGHLSSLDVPQHSPVNVVAPHLLHSTQAAPQGLQCPASFHRRVSCSLSITHSNTRNRDEPMLTENLSENVGKTKCLVWHFTVSPHEQNQQFLKKNLNNRASAAIMLASSLCLANISVRVIAITNTGSTILVSFPLPCHTTHTIKKKKSKAQYLLLGAESGMQDV